MTKCKKKKPFHTNYKAEARDCSGQIQCIVCDISIPPSMLATLKGTGRIRAELLRGSEDGVVGEGLKTLNELALIALATITNKQ